tara:strand:+ start:395 stop:1663 length:1269 start_codon:yes stop_codon:yes gene_type:complete
MSKEQTNSKTKSLAIKYYLDNDVSQKEVSKIFNINERTFRRWLEKYNNDELNRPARETKSYKVKKKHVEYVLKLLDKNPTLSIKLLWENTKAHFDDFEISQSQLSRVIRDNNVTRKRTRTRHYPETRYNKKIDFKKEMKIFYREVDKFDVSKIISIDETSINAEMTASKNIFQSVLWLTINLCYTFSHEILNDKIINIFLISIFISVLYNITFYKEYLQNIKQLFLFLIILTYLKKESFMKNTYHSKFRYLLFINISMMSIPAIYHKQYILAFLLLSNSCLIPTNYTTLDNKNPLKYYYHLSKIFVFLQYYTFEKSFIHWSLWALTTIIPMLININKNPMLTRMMSLVFPIFLTHYNLFTVSHKIAKSKFIAKKKTKPIFTELADTFYKYNDSKKSRKIYLSFSVINIIILLKNVYLKYVTY